MRKRKAKPLTLFTTRCQVCAWPNLVSERDIKVRDFTGGLGMRSYFACQRCKAHNILHPAGRGGQQESRPEDAPDGKIIFKT